MIPWTSLEWWYVLVIPGFGRWRQEHQEFKASLGYLITAEGQIPFDIVWTLRGLTMFLIIFVGHMEGGSKIIPCLKL